MAQHYGTIHAKKVRGHVRISGMGRTPSGQTFIKESVILQCSSLSDKTFKAEAREAIKKMYLEPAPKP